MIRRGFWLVLGAAAGVSGYRRASRLARSILPAGHGSALARPRPPVITGRGLLAAAATAGRGTARGVAFARDVRDGMAEYLDRHEDGAGRTLDSQRGGERGGGRRAQAAPGARHRGTAP